MVIIKTDDFFSEFKKLPSATKTIFYRQEEIFLRNWLDERLHIKKAQGIKKSIFV
jgi:hypothetical protein